MFIQEEECRISLLNYNWPPFFPTKEAALWFTECMTGTIPADWWYLLTQYFGLIMESLCKESLRIKWKLGAHLASCTVWQNHKSRAAIVVLTVKHEATRSSKSLLKPVPQRQNVACSWKKASVFTLESLYFIAANILTLYNHLYNIWYIFETPMSLVWSKFCLKVQWKQFWLNYSINS